MYAPRDGESLPDPTSRVPSYTFGETLAEQEAQLRTNPLLRRFNESRKRLASDPHRPIYHYVNPEGNLNDPNGLCFWRGRWHLFYQAYPPEDPRQHWGHAVSDDLVHWRDLPLAIYPSPEEKVFSGTTLVEDDRVIAIYHGVGAGTMVAVSDDPLLLNWRKHERTSTDGVDRCSSGAWFDGWKGDRVQVVGEAPVMPPGTWLAREGWRYHGLLRTDERPAPA